jgi:endonuclease YncB( thermonuclease family)
MHIISFIKNYFFVFLFFFGFQLSLQAKVVCMCVTTPVTFLEVIDGDTIWVKKEDKKVVVEFEGIDAPELDHEENKTQDCLHDQKKAEKARNLIQNILSSAKEVGLIIKEEINEQELRAQVYADGLSVGQELLYKHLAVKGQGKWCEINERD